MFQLTDGSVSDICLRMEIAYPETECADRDNPQSMSLFGALDNNPNAASTSAFGNNQQQSPTGNINIFGNTQPVAQTSLFGNAQQSQPTASLFGNANSGATAGGNVNGGTNTNNAAQSTGTLGGNPLNVVMGSFDSTPIGMMPNLFGNTTQPMTTGGSILAPTTQPLTTGGSSFGNAQNQSTGTSPFGNTATTTAQPTTGNSLFGSTNTTQPATGNSLFGNTNTTQPATGGNLFGNTTTNQPVTGGSLVGNTSTTGNTSIMTTQPAGSASTTNQSTTSLFGNTLATNQPSNSLFGNTSTANPPPATNTTQPTSLFGNVGTNTGTGTTQQQPSLFGDKPGGLFGSTSAASGAGLLTGAQTQQLQQLNQPSLFGSTTATQLGALFGNTQNNAIGSSLFGDKPQGTLFGNTTGSSNAFNTSTLSSSFLGSKTPAQQQAVAQAQALQLQQKIEAIYNAWNPNSPQCQFQVCSI